jgi:2-polyprenyl-3-methyl-5-hydroxy-6-metoxy-1,4-benzoquinol methylase
MARTQEINCNLCGHTDAVFCFHGEDRLHGFAGTFTYVRCAHCGLTYMNPQICLEDLPLFYPKDYGPHLAKSSEQAKPIIKKKRLPLPENILGQLTHSSQVLDIGCGNGKFLYSLQQATQCQVYGLDISANAAAVAQDTYGLRIDQGTLFDAPYAEEQFDLIVAWHYIEHVVDPMSIFQKVVALLKPGAWFCLMTPNIASFTARLFRDKWFSLDCPRHLFLFSPPTIRRYLTRANLDIRQISFEGSSKHLARSLQYAIYKNNFDVKHQNRIAASPVVKTLASPIMDLFQLLRHSDAMNVVAQKPFKDCV